MENSPTLGTILMSFSEWKIKQRIARWCEILLSKTKECAVGVCNSQDLSPENNGWEEAKPNGDLLYDPMAKHSWNDQPVNVENRWALVSVVSKREVTPDRMGVPKYVWQWGGSWWLMGGDRIHLRQDKGNRSVWNTLEGVGAGPQKQGCQQGDCF